MTPEYLIANYTFLAIGERNMPFYYLFVPNGAKHHLERDKSPIDGLIAIPIRARGIYLWSKERHDWTEIDLTDRLEAAFRIMAYPQILDLGE